jgi:tRNA A-37 threonylcarbamoyl transferase component Bud32
MPAPVSSLSHPAWRFILMGVKITLTLNDQLARPDREVLETRRLAGLWQEALPLAGGRGTARTLRLGELDLVLKREARGGWGARILPDLYLLRGPFQREWRLACRLSALGLSPQPVAQEFRDRGPFFEAYSASLAIAEGKSLAESWREGRMDASLWRRAGKAVGRLHREGVLHGDLNVGNLIVAGDESFLFLDLRHSRFGREKPSARARARNLKRLARSLHKLNATQGLSLPEDLWGLLLEGYAEAWGERERWLEGWDARTARGFPLRRLLWRKDDS